MGSRITRSLGITDRSRRVDPAAVNDVKSFIRGMNCSMFGFLAFSLGFLSTRSLYEPVESSLQYIGFASVSVLMLNLSNQQICMIVGWLMVVIQTLFLHTSMTTMFSFGVFLTMYCILSNIFNYYSSPHWFSLRNLKASAICIVMGLILQIGHCSGHFLKESNKQNQIRFGMRLVLCFLGTMVVALGILGHVHVRSSRFVSINPNQQLAYIQSIGFISIIQMGLLVYGFKQLLLVMQSRFVCSSGFNLILVFVLGGVLLIGVGFGLKFVVFRVEQNSHILQYSAIILVVVNAVFSFTEFPFFILYPLQIILLFVTVMIATNIITDVSRINYIIALFTVFLCQANDYQNVHVKSQNNLGQWSIIVGGIGVGAVLRVFYDRLMHYRRYAPVGSSQLGRA